VTLKYKGMDFSEQSAPFVRHMMTVNSHRETLGALHSSWDTLSLLGHLSNMKTDMGQTREAFDRLTGELMASLADETLARVASGLGYKAQVAIDILTRNLFERTADIGFLATDSDVVAAATSGDAQLLLRLQSRFARYAQRYSVYRDIVLLDPSGQVVSRMKPGFMGQSASGILARAASGAAYVETFEPTDFCGGLSALTYAAAVRDAKGRHAGVLALEFDLLAEAETVFGRLAAGDELVAFLDSNGRVVVSNDPLRLPVGYRPQLPGATPHVRLAGQSYVAVQRKPKPYQGYEGPGWSAIALVAADTAFEQGAVSQGVEFSGESIFSERLLGIPLQASTIQRNLDRVVWNGRLQQARSEEGSAADFSRALLEQIASTGRRTQAVFDAATYELLDTVTATVLDEARFLAGLAVDILDRNLYERACDCRWWTEDATLAALDPAACAAILRHINSLYTVYTNIVLFDAAGKVVASSSDPELAGHALDEPWVSAALQLSDPMRYAVSRFADTPLYGGQSTYIYSAPLRAGGRVVGGVGLVFDSTPQFRAMLEAALPARAGAVGAFVRPDGSIVSATADLPLALPAEALGLRAGDAWSGIVSVGGACFAVGATAGSGYREFKTTDGYAECIISVIVVPCGSPASRKAARRELPASVAGGTEVATFYIGDDAAAVQASEVIECIEVRLAVAMPRAKGSSSRHTGFTQWRDTVLPLIDLSEELGALGAPSRHAVVMQHGGVHFGLLVAELGAIVDLEITRSPATARLNGRLELVTHIARSGDMLLPMLSAASVAGLSIAERKLA
jgi:chemotaxis signal transduction protein